QQDRPDRSAHPRDAPEPEKRRSPARGGSVAVIGGRDGCRSGRRCRYRRERRRGRPAHARQRRNL
ncbi:hypothetical protein H2201_009375, partial [Coniosporium apollinis]